MQDQDRFFLKGLSALLACIPWLGGMPLLAAVGASIPSDAQKLQLTIYNQNFGVVRDERKVTIQHNPETFQFDNVAEQIQANSVRLRSLTDPHAIFLEHYYEYDLSSPDKLLQKYRNKPLTISLKDGSHYTGNLLHFDGSQLILQDEQHVTMIPRENNVKDILFSPLQGFFRQPSLVWKAATEQLGDQWVELSYQTNGLNWQANYNALLNAQESKMDLQAWVTLSNESGASYQGAELKLMAGETKRVQPVAMMATSNAFSKRQYESGVHEESFFEYHLYSLDHPITIGNNQTKQIQLFDALEVPVKKRFVYEGAPQMSFWHEKPLTDAQYGMQEEIKNVQVFIEFKNSLEDHMGMPLPQGAIRFYKQDATGHSSELIGENSIKHTPKNEKIELAIGNAFDVVGHRKRIDFQVDLGRRIMTEEFEIKLENQRNSPIEVLVKEPLYRWNSWEIISSTLPFEKYDANTIHFHVPVEKEGLQTFTYTVRYAW